MALPIKVIKNHIVFPVRDPDKVRAIFPEVKIGEVNGSYICAVPHTIDAVRFFQNNGHPLPSPIMTTYPWPGRFKPYAHQMATSEFLTLNRRCFCLSGMGTMKTASALWATDFLMKQGEVDKCLIVSPLSTLEQVWAKEIFQVLPGRRYHVLHARGKGARERRQKLLADKKADFYIINHDGIEIICDLLKERPDINHVIVDECFPAGTEISTPSGKKAIETLLLNDIILSSWGPLPITHIFKKQATRLIRLHFEDETHVDCTPEHPFATEKGWQAAQDLQGLYCLRECDLQELRKGESVEALPGDARPHFLQSGVSKGILQAQLYLSDLWAGVYRRPKLFSAQLGEVLLGGLWSKSKSNRGENAGQGVRGLRERLSSARCWGAIQTATMLFADMRQKMGVGQQPQHAGCSGETRGENPRQACLEQRGFWPRLSKGAIARGASREVSPEPERQWYRVDTRGSYAGATFAERVHSVLSDFSRETENTGLSNMLQSGFWARREEDSSRSRREQSRQPATQSARQKEGTKTLGTRVVCIEDLEQGSPQWVWNLEVAGPHDYIANGKVVHNCAVFRNARTRRCRILFEILNRQGIDRSAWGLTGTPTPNAPTDCHGQLRLIVPEKHRSSFKALQNELMYQISQFKWVPRPRASERVFELMQPAIRYALEDCVDLPPTIYQTRTAELSPQQEKHYNELRRQAFTEIEGTAVSAVNAGVLLSKLVQCSCGCIYGPGGEVVELDFGPRLSVLRDTIEECNEKVIVFVPFTGALNALHDELKKDWSVAIVDGSVSSTKRNQIFKDFQNSENPHILLANAGAMAHGLTLTAASTIIWFAPTTSNETFQQANARIVRPGQTKTTNIVMLQGTKAEEGIYTALREKGKLQDVLLSLVKGA